MEENKIKFNAFKNAQTKADWEVAAREELNGANPWDKLSQQGDGWSILPYYDQKEKKSAPLLLPSGSDFSGARTWYNCPKIVVDDAKKANESALESLRQGADGILFELPEEIDFNILLKNIEWQYCSLSFLASKNQEAHITALDSFIIKHKLTKDQINGAFFGNTLATDPLQSGFHFTGFQIKPMTSPVEELATAFKEVLRSEKLRNVAFSITIGTDFFLSIAKLRALRLIWQKYSNRSIFIHAYSPAWINNSFQPHGNMLKSTTAAMAAILGGCNALTIDPENADQTMMSRAARNVSNVLREESFFSKVADPLAGSYFIEDLSNQLTDAAWNSIQPYLPK